MIELLLEVALSIIICVVAAYFFFLSSPVEEYGVGEGSRSYEHGSNISNSRGGYSKSSDNRHLSPYSRRNASSLERSKKCEPAMWCNVVGRLVSLLVLGGGSVDGNVWVDRIAYFIGKGVKSVDEAFDEGRKTRGAHGITTQTLRVKADMLRLLRMELSSGGTLSTAGGAHHQQQQSHSTSPQVGGMFHTRTSSEHARGVGIFGEPPEGGAAGGTVATGVGCNNGPAPANSPLVGVVLPRVGPGGITSVEVPLSAVTQELGFDDCGTHVAESGRPSMLRCFAVPITYEDHRFLLHVVCNLPLLAALPQSLSIPSDVLTLRCGLSVKRVVFHGVLYAAFCGNSIELSFSSEPQFTALFDVAPPRRQDHHDRYYQQQNQPHSHLLPTECNSARGPAASVSNASSLPLPPSTLAAHNSSQRYGSNVNQGVSNEGHRTREKLQEIVDAAVRRAIQSITYPCVLRGHLNKGTMSKAQSVGGGETEQLFGVPNTGLLTWTLERASLPLCC
ncbi:hypothetical protein, conserved [Trypanosoma brucei brucei TREU927]|uniref:Uncharacterized protein n=1 Tax=Trypanosoma brucei brucei (strain 927/4 GUTat10.1) TaxID=185431 RepID=Q382V2_TRYB2|nr:hypothetical protein, conserved [Trypanosoma brucei brucei TREU927]EAN80179.1 hypothetical protein, conserved [Trypanosoma brucei brucei TREU927]